MTLKRHMSIWSILAFPSGIIQIGHKVVLFIYLLRLFLLFKALAFRVGNIDKEIKEIEQKKETLEHDDKMEGKPCRYNNMGYCRVGKDQWMKHVISI